MWIIRQRVAEVSWPLMKPLRNQCFLLWPNSSPTIERNTFPRRSKERHYGEVIGCQSDFRIIRVVCENIRGDPSSLDEFLHSVGR